MYEDEVRKLQEESWGLEIKKSKAQEEVFKCSTRLQEITTRITEILRDNYKAQAAISNLNQLVVPQTGPTSLKMGGKIFNKKE